MLNEAADRDVRQFSASSSIMRLVHIMSYRHVDRSQCLSAKLRIISLMPFSSFSLGPSGNGSLPYCSWTREQGFLPLSSCIAYRHLYATYTPPPPDRASFTR